MNTSIQLYNMNTSMTPNMCPIWPVTPAVGTQLMTLPVLSYDDHLKLYTDRQLLDRINKFFGKSFKSLEELSSYEGSLERNREFNLHDALSGITSKDVLSGTSAIISFVKQVKLLGPCIALEPKSCINYLSAGIIADKLSSLADSENLTFVGKSQRLAFHVLNEANNLNFIIGLKNCFGRNWRPCAMSVTFGSIYKYITG